MGFGKLIRNLFRGEGVKLETVSLSEQHWSQRPGTPWSEVDIQSVFE
jgi:hypothetical protein